MHRSLLMPDQNVLDGVLLKNGIVDVQDGSTRVAEKVFDTFFLQAAHDNFCASKFHDLYSFQDPGSPPAGASAIGRSHRRRPRNGTCEVERTPQHPLVKGATGMR
jgi:hypothetical protein